MKIIHTADWHLGKKLQNIDLIDDQRIVLQAFIEDLIIEEPDVLIIAGDLYDRAIPSKEAVDLLNETLARIVLDLKIPTLAIAGNHDSASRLHFGSSFMEKQGLHLVGKYKANYQPVVLYDTYGEIYFHLVPYFDPSLLKYEVEDETIRSFDDAMAYVTDLITAEMTEESRHIFIGHLFVTPQGEKAENTSDSERILSVGGAEYVQASHFEAFDYTALGHLHQAHSVGQDRIRYAGSLMKYSQSEEKHEKGYYIIDLKDKGAIEIEKRQLKMPRDIRTIRANIDEIFAMPKSDDYIFVELLDKTPVLSPMSKVRTVFPNCMRVTRAVQTAHNSSKKMTLEAREKMDDYTLFQAFYEEVTGEVSTDETNRLFKEALEIMTKE